jgi:hypothetical protein
MQHSVFCFEKKRKKKMEKEQLSPHLPKYCALRPEQRYLKKDTYLLGTKSICKEKYLSQQWITVLKGESGRTHSCLKEHSNIYVR